MYNIMYNIMYIKQFYYSNCYIIDKSIVLYLILSLSYYETAQSFSNRHAIITFRQLKQLTKVSLPIELSLLIFNSRWYSFIYISIKRIERKYESAIET